MTNLNYSCVAMSGSRGGGGGGGPFLKSQILEIWVQISKGGPIVSRGRSGISWIPLVALLGLKPATPELITHVISEALFICNGRTVEYKLITLCSHKAPKRVLLQTVKTQMKCCKMRHFIRVSTIC